MTKIKGPIKVEPITIKGFEVTYPVVYCLRPATTPISPGCQGRGRCTCECNGCNGAAR